MNEAVVRERIDEMQDVINACPAVSTNKDGSYISVQKQLSLEEALNILRLQVKYLVFDLEATRRENRYLRQMLESRHRPRQGPSDEEPI